MVGGERQMNDTRSSSSGGGVSLFAVMFIALKVTGHWYISTWSWWWVLLPIVPMFGWLLQ